MYSSSSSLRICILAAWSSASRRCSSSLCLRLRARSSMRRLLRKPGFRSTSSSGFTLRCNNKPSTHTSLRRRRRRHLITLQQFTHTEVSQTLNITSLAKRDHVFTSPPSFIISNSRFERGQQVFLGSFRKSSKII